MSGLDLIKTIKKLDENTNRNEQIAKEKVSKNVKHNEILI